MPAIVEAVIAGTTMIANQNILNEAAANNDHTWQQAAEAAAITAASVICMHTMHQQLYSGGWAISDSNALAAAIRAKISKKSI